jgi:hypothetical protein
MTKENIKNKLREGLLDKLREAGKDPQGDTQVNHNKNADDSDAKKKDNRGTKKDYNDIQNYFQKDLSFSQVDVMKKALGWKDDPSGVNRSLFGKMLHQDRNDEGGLYQFDDDQLDRVRTAIKNKQ